ncbi:MAG: FlgD immunoglobulin-like domain containing protein [Candidatus Delongbacteria bacterium]
MRNTLCLLALSLIGLAGAPRAQLSELWSVSESELVVSWLWPDLNGDGVQELIMEDGVGSWFFDGTSEYEQVWYVADPNSSANTIFGLWLQQDGWCVFRQQNSTDQQARLHVYAAGAATESWNTGLLPGNVTEGGIGDFDGDGQLELAWSWHSWDGSAWTSQWTVRNLATGAVELAVQTGAGYLSGPWTGNVEGDASEELLLNWYWNTGLSQVFCWGRVDTALAPQSPTSPGLRTWPNPFNPLCHIDVAAEAGVGSVGIFNLAGEEVRRLPLTTPGRANLIWDGLDQRGRPAASGTYLVRAGDRTRPITLLR